MPAPKQGYDLKYLAPDRTLALDPPVRCLLVNNLQSSTCCQGLELTSVNIAVESSKKKWSANAHAKLLKITIDVYLIKFKD